MDAADGVVDGASVLFSNTQADEDTVVKPSTFGFETSTILRSVNSPSQLFYRVGLPKGASLVQHGESGVVQVVKEGVVLATIAMPLAEDATGATVPVSMTASGTMLTVTAGLSAGEFKYPIDVDPEVIDESRSFDPGDWAFYTDDSSVFKGSYSSFKEKVGEHTAEGSGPTDSYASSETYYKGDYGYFVYNTQGASRIYAFVASIREDNINLSLLDQLALRTSGGETESGNGEGGKAELLFNSVFKEWSGLTVCSSTTCSPQPASGSEHNGAYFEQKAQGEASSSFEFMLTGSKVEIEQEKLPKASFDTSDATIEGQANALLSGKWYKSTSNVVFGIDAEDPGIGIFKQGLSSPAKSGWGYALKNESRNECQGVQCNECYETPCVAKESGNGKPLTFSLAGAAGGELPEGEDTVEGKVEDAAGLNATAVGKVKIDDAPPTITSFSGLPSSHELVDGERVSLKASAKGSLAGIASITLDVDGQQISGPQGSCTGTSCTGHAEWVLNDDNYAAGEHTLTVIVEDNAGNIDKEEYHVVIHHAENIAVGPGSVNPVTGELSLSASDVSIGVPDGTLTVTRSYRSQHLEQGVEGPLGAQWNLALGPQQSLARISGGMILTGDNGGQIVFESKGGGEFTSPTGDAGLILSEKTKESKTTFTLSDSGSITTFELPAGSAGGVYLPSSNEGPNGTSVTLYKFKLNSGVAEPTEELAPVPAGVSCGKEVSELKEGCRALKFEYDEGETKAKGEKSSEWGEFKGHLSKVRYIAWNGSKTKQEPIVAEYAYDVKGRLRAVWNPQIKPELKTTYGYDSENHVTSVSTAGHEPVLLEQGTVPGESGPGRLLAVAVPSAGTALGSGEAPVSSEAPTLSSTAPKVGVKISVNLNSEKIPGKWTGSPLAFIYQWEDCNKEGKECSPIPGAVNQAYYPVASDEGHKLVAEASALNATGATTVATAATASTVASGTPNSPAPEPPEVGSDAVTTLEYEVPISGSGAPYEMGSTKTAEWAQTDDPHEAMAVFPPDKVMGWPAKEYKRETVYYLDGKDRAVNMAIPTGGIATTEYNQYNDVIRMLSPDNRAAALKEGSKSAEKAEVLSTDSVYEEKGAEPGTELLSTTGPRHTIKLAGGGQVEARAHTIYSYNEGAPQSGAPYHLVTKMVQNAVLNNGEEKEPRTTVTSYNGQKDLGWVLRKPTAVTIDPSGLDLTTVTEYSSATGEVTLVKKPGGTSETVTPPSSVQAVGSEGTGAGQFKHPNAVAIAGTRWLVLDKENNRVEVFGSKDEFIETFGFGVSNGESKYETCKSSCRAGLAGSGAGQMSSPEGITDSEAGLKSRIYVSDSANNRIDVYGPSYEFIEAFGWGVKNGASELQSCTTTCQKGLSGSGNGELNHPQGITVDAEGNIWVVDKGNNRLQEFSEAGAYKTQIGSKGSGQGQFSEPTGVVSSDGELYVLDSGNDRVEELSPSGTDLETFGSSGLASGDFKEPKGIAVNPTSGILYVADSGNNRVEEFSASGQFLAEFGTAGTGQAQMQIPAGVAVNSQGQLYVADEDNNRIDEWQLSFSSELMYSTQFGVAGAQAGQVDHPNGVALDGEGNVWVSDSANNRIEKFSSNGTFLAAYGWGVSDGKAELESCTSSCEAGIAGAGKGQFSDPRGIGVNKSTGNVYVADSGNNRIEEMSSTGTFVKAWGTEGTGNGQFKTPVAVAVNEEHVWALDYGNDRVEEFSLTGSYKTKWGTKGTGNSEFKEPEGIEAALGKVFVADTGNNRVQMFEEGGKYLTQFGSEGSAGGQFKSPVGIGSDSLSFIYVADKGNDRIQRWEVNGSAVKYVGATGSYGSGNGQLSEPTGVTASYPGNVYVADTANNRIEKWTLDQKLTHNTQTVYYSAAANSEYPGCGEHPQWANLICQTQPQAQPNYSPLVPNARLPITTYAYNVWDEPETIEEKIELSAGTTTRTKSYTYDEAGRLKTTSIKSSTGESLPTITDEYNTETGALEKQSANGKTITSVYNKLGQMTGYTDAAESTTTYEYNINGTTKKIADSKGTETKGTETFTYNTTTGLLEELLYEYAPSKLQLSFTATYDAEGNMLTESYPNGMTASYTYDQVGKPTSLVYKKTTHCTEEEKEKCKWFTDTVVPSIYGQWLEQTSSLSHQAYTYDHTGRLTQVQNTPTGQGCTTRNYAYEEETNRTSLITSGPNTKGECTEENPSAERHVYDEANRLVDTGTTYNTYGDITALPATDAGGSELKTEYYVDNQVKSQTQKEQTIGYTLDPAGRTLETIATGKPNNATTINHYAGSSNNPAWTSSAIGSEWTRNITGIGGTLDAIQANGETPELQLTNLHGDIVAKAYLSETATELAGKADTSEYGVPTVSAPAKYSWLGAIQLPTELPSGVVNMGARSYVPQIGRFLQPDPVPGGSANAYAYTFGDPVNTSDPTGDYTNTASAAILRQMQLEGEGIASSGLANHERIEREQREAFERRAAEEAARAAAEAAAEAAGAAGPQYGEGEEWEEWWEEESGYEYASYDQHGGTSGKEEARIEPAILVQPLSGESGSGGESSLGAVPLCKAGSEGPCAYDAGGVREKCMGSMCKPHRVEKIGTTPGNQATGCRDGLIAYGVLGVASDFLDPPKALAACIVGEVIYAAEH